jgi:predicted nucleic acid binding AN1-type Zn finger protein
MENNSKKCPQKRWNEEHEPFINHIAFTQHLEKEVERETPNNMTNEATEYACEYCGCDHCGQPLLLRECNDCGAILCGCHFMPEEHDCSALPIKQSWAVYAQQQEKFKTYNV